jgi:hypothetical protein
MSTNWLRYAKITIEGSGGTIDCSELRCKFNITDTIIQTPNQLRLYVYNMKKETAQQIVKAQSMDKKVTLDIGYEDNHAVMFSGQIKQAIYGRENPTDTFLFVLASGEYGYNYATVNKTFKKGSTQQDIFDEAMKALKEFGASKGTIMPDLSKIKYPQPVVIYAMARDVIRNIALTNDCSWWIDTIGQGGELHIVDKDKPIEGNEVTLNSKTGLIGMPQQTMDGIIVRCLINPKMMAGRTVRIDQASVRPGEGGLVTGGELDPSTALMPGISADGVYKIVKLDVDGDNRGQNWYCDMVCLDPNQPGGGQYSKYIGTV